MTNFIFWSIKVVVDCVNRTILDSFVKNEVVIPMWVGYLQISHDEFYTKN